MQPSMVVKIDIVTRSPQWLRGDPATGDPVMPSALKLLKKLSTGALSQQSPVRLMLGVIRWRASTARKRSLAY